MRLEDKVTRIAIPSKGRLQEPSETLLKAAGVKYRKRDRSLFAHVDGLNAVILFVRPDDIPLLVAEGAADMGMVGQDLVHENKCEGRVKKRLDLGYGHCRLALAARANGGAKNAKALKGHKVAASMGHSAREFFRKKNVDVQLLEVSGSVEIMVALGLADAIVDLVESGDTLRDNGLEVIETVSQSQAVLIETPKPRDRKLCELIVRRFEGVLTAQQYTLLEYNVPRAKLKEAEKITPGFDSPTLSDLEDKNWVSVKVMIPKKQSIDIMDKLEALGASAILETQILNCRL
ncbi:MAG TPA: ATP phosphoribosyltransferase [Planctomycetota bacterium]|nr:ATP phosphoribosyltransferase [Planctomycetota bacterium]